MNREEKKQAVSGIEAIYNDNSIIIVTHYHGLSVSQLSSLRKSLRSEGSAFKVVKNNLAKIAARNVGIEGIDNFLSGPVGIVFSQDPVSASKIVAKFSKENQALKLVGALYDKKVVEKEVVMKLSELPSMDELRGTIIGLVQAPAAKVARIMAAPASQIARVISAYSNKN